MKKQFTLKSGDLNGYAERLEVLLNKPYNRFAIDRFATDFINFVVKEFDTTVIKLETGEAIKGIDDKLVDFYVDNDQEFESSDCIVQEYFERENGTQAKGHFVRLVGTKGYNEYNGIYTAIIDFEDEIYLANPENAKRIQSSLSTEI